MPEENNLRSAQGPNRDGTNSPSSLGGTIGSSSSWSSASSLPSSVLNDIRTAAWLRDVTREGSGQSNDPVVEDDAWLHDGPVLPPFGYSPWPENARANKLCKAGLLFLLLAVFVKDYACPFVSYMQSDHHSFEPLVPGKFQRNVQRDQCHNFELPSTCREDKHSKPLIKLHFVGTDGRELPNDVKRAFHDAAKYWSIILQGQKQLPRTIVRDEILHRLWGGSYPVWGQDIEEYCGVSPVFADFDGLTVCVRQSHLGGGMPWQSHSEEGTPAAAQADILRRNDIGMPTLSAVQVNTIYAHTFCGWFNLAAHELAHALGFNHYHPGYKKLLSLDANGNAWIFAGNNQDVSSVGSHWEPSCFHRELMDPYFHDEYEKTRAPLSSFTLYVFDALGYNVNFNCHDNTMSLSQSCTKPRSFVAIYWKEILVCIAALLLAVLGLNLALPLTYFMFVSVLSFCLYLVFLPKAFEMLHSNS